MRIHGADRPQIKKSTETASSKNIKPKLEKGQVFEATVSESTGKKLTLTLSDGTSFVTKNASDKAYSPFQQYEFEVIEAEPHVLVRVRENGENTLLQTLQSLFSGSKSVLTPSILEAARALSHFGIPLSVENINGLLETTKQVDLLSGLVKGGMISLEDIPENMPIKDILVNHFSKNLSGKENENLWVRFFENNEKNLELIGEGSNKKIQAQNKISDENSVSIFLNGSEKTASIKNPNLSSLDLESTKLKVQGLKVEETKGENNKNAQEVKTQASQMGKDILDTAETKKESVESNLTKALISLLEKVNLQTLAIHQKADMESSIKNLALFEAIFAKKFPIGEQFQGLAKKLAVAFPLLSKETQSLILGWLEGKDGIKADEELKVVLETLKNHPQYERVQELQEAFERGEEVRQSMGYLRQLQENLAYIQLPLMIDQSIQTVDYFVKKNKKKKTQNDELNIFLSLNTHHLNTVQVSILYKKDSIDLQFQVSGEKAIHKFENEKQNLKNSLEKSTHKTIHLSIRQKDEQKSLINTLASFYESESQAIDVRV